MVQPPSLGTAGEMCAINPVVLEENRVVTLPVTTQLLESKECQTMYTKVTGDS